MSAHTDPGVMAMMREMCARLSEVGLTDTQTHAIVAAYDAIVAERDAAVRLIDDAAAHWLALNIGHPIQWEGAIDAAMAAACNEIRSLKSRLAACEKIVEAVAAIDPTIYNRRGDVIALSQAANVATETFRAAVAAETQGEKDA